jgi:tRNA pseudouridine55 synthase
VLHGWIILDKPAGLGSTSAVTAVKRALRAAGEPKTKVGHGGTLDPLATGVLPIAVGEATKLCGRMLDSDKAYEFAIRFGEETDTLDAEGKIVARSDVVPSIDQLVAILPRFTGAIQQAPPTYSALKIDGKPAYARARAGEALEMKLRSVTVRELHVMALFGNEATLSATVSKGTYVRSLARDIARALGSFGHIVMLRRTKAGPFTLEQAISLDFLDQAAKARQLTRMVMPLTAALDDIPALSVTPDQARLLRQGQRLAGFPATPGLQLALLDQSPVALVEASADGLKVVRGFNI